MNKRIRKAIFPVGGLGVRFLPATKALPKEMLPVVDRPLIQYAVDEARDSGIEEFIFVTGRGKTAIENHFDYSFELLQTLKDRNMKEEIDAMLALSPNPGQIAYVRQQEPLGLGHAVWCARHLIGDEPFAVILADDLIKSKISCLKQMINLYSDTNSTIVAIEKINKKDCDRYGIIDYSSKSESLYSLKSIIEKPSYAKAKTNLAVVGRYILPSNIFGKIKKSKPGVGKEIQITDAISELIKDYDVYGYAFEGKRFDCGSKLGYLKATTEYAMEHKELSRDFKNYLKRLKI